MAWRLDDQVTHAWDETWRRLREWTNGPGASERLGAQIVLSDGYENLDPSHPLGGPDGRKDAICKKDGESWVMAVYFPTEQQPFSAIKAKLRHDVEGVIKNEADGLVFVTNQQLPLSQRRVLRELVSPIPLDLYHLERITAILDRPGMAPVRRQFLQIDAEVPTFSGTVGHFEEATTFDEFIAANLRRIVHLDVWMSESEPTVPGFERSTLLLWTRRFGPGESTVFNCEGTAYNVDADPDIPESTLMWYRGFLRLQGYFSVVGIIGPHQGIMSVRLRPVRVEDVLRTR